MQILLIVPFLILSFATQVFAETQVQAAKGTIVSLSAEATVEVANDEVMIRFRVEARGKKLEVLRKRVNQISASIKKSLAKEKSVKLKTSNRRVDPVWKPNQYNRVRDGWVVTQRSVIVSQNLDDVPRWLDVIEHAGAKLETLNFRISDTLRRSTQDKLRIRAIQMFRDKASVIAKALGAKYFHVRHLNAGQSYSPQPMLRGDMAMMTKSRAVEPALSAGDSRLSVNVTGDIEVERKRYLVR
ncbi:MAG: SIMPL domain-containing protein [Ghiorsea sp.]|nr:SIMPL domain-containing protein [Ghiorsea sp.]